MKDKAGRTVKPGDIIVYGKSFGRSAGMQYGKVLGVERKASPYFYPGSTYPKTVERLRFVGVDESLSKRALQKPSTLSYGDRILVVSWQQVGKAALKLLDTVDERATR